MELATAHLNGTLETRRAIRHLQVLIPTTESKRAVKQLIRYPRGTHNTSFLF